MQYVLFLTCLTAGGGGLPVLATTGYTIDHIRVVGNATIEEELLIALSGLEAGVLLTSFSDQIGVSIRKIAKYEGIKTVSIYLTDIDEAKKAATCVIQVEEHPKLAGYMVEGLSTKEKKSLLEQVKIPVHATLSPMFLRNTVSSIKKYFLEKGFRTVEVATELIPGKETKNKLLLKLKITKGNKNTVDKIVFQGNKHIDSNLLRYHIKELNEAPRFTLFKDIIKKVITLKPFRKKKITLQAPNLGDKLKSYLFEHVSFLPSLFTEDKYLKAKENIILFYKSQGFQDARITATHFQQSPSGKITICFNIEEGKSYKIRHIRWVGNHRYSDQELTQLLNLTQGNPYDPVYIKKQLEPNPISQTIGNIYYNNGYLYFRTEVIETGIEDHHVDLEIRIYEGKQAIINQVHIVGNTITHDEIIRRELYTKPGDTFNLQHVQESLRNLTMLKFFYPLSSPNLAVSETGDTVDITYVVKEKFSMDIRAGLSYAEGLKGSVVLGSDNVSLKNLCTGKIPLGAAQHLSFKGEFGKQKQKELSLTFRDPWLWWGKHRYMFSFSISNSYTHSPHTKTSLDYLSNFLLFPIEKQHKNESMQATSCWVSLGRKLARYWSMQLGMNYVYHNYQHYAGLTNRPKKSGISHDVHMEILLSYDSTDNPYYPTKGLSWMSNLIITPPYTLLGHTEMSQSTIPYLQEFGKYMVDLTYFKKLPGNFVFHICGHAGFLFSLSKNKIGPFHRFHMGGTSPLASGGLFHRDFIALRGYASDSLTPRNYQKQLQGGVLFQKLSLELRYPLALNFTYIYLLGFADIGNSWLEYERCHYKTMKKSIGVGLRIFTPIPIIPMLGIDVGYRLDPIKEVNAHAPMHPFEWHLILQPLSR